MSWTICQQMGAQVTVMAFPLYPGFSRLAQVTLMAFPLYPGFSRLSQPVEPLDVGSHDRTVRSPSQWQKFRSATTAQTRLQLQITSCGTTTQTLLSCQTTCDAPSAVGSSSACTNSRCFA